MTATHGVQVLVLNSYHAGYSWSDDEVRGIRSVLSGPLDPAEVAVEYLDAKRDPRGEQSDLLRQLFARKYPRQSLKAVLAADDPALQFALRYRKELFDGVPVVFCGINEHDPGVLRDVPGVTGVYQNDDLVGTLDLIRRLQPTARALRVVCDYTVSGLGARHQLARVLPRFGSWFQVEFAPDESMQDLRGELAVLPKGTVVLLLVYANDRTGRVWEIDEGTRSICDSAPVPVYAVSASRLGYGIVGGSLLSAEQHGARAAKMVMRILAGTPVDSIPADEAGGAAPMFDYQALQRFGLHHRRLPLDASVINAPAERGPAPRGLLRAAAAGGLLLLAAVLAWVLWRRRGPTAGQEGEDRFAAVFETAPLSIALSRADGTLLAVNKAFEEQWGWSAAEIVGRQPTDFGLYVRPADRVPILAQLHETGRLEQVEVQMRARDGREVATLLSSAKVQWHGQECLLSVLVDAAPQRAAADLQRSEGLARAACDRLAAVAAIAGELLSCRDETALYRTTVELARERLGVPRCSLFLRDGDYRQGTFGTDRDGRTIDEQSLREVLDDDWERLFDRATFADSPWSLVQEPLTETTDGQPVAFAEGWIARTPVTCGDEVVAVFCNDAGLSRAPFDASLQQAVAVLCSLLGHIIRRTHEGAESVATASAERLLQRRLRALAEISNQLSLITDFDELCRQAVELGRQRLGFDRLGLWFRVEDQPLAQGSFGTDEHGQTRDERGLLVAAAPQSALGHVWEMHGQALVDRAAPLRDQHGRVIGHGMAIFAGLWNGERVTGSLNCDNLFSRTPLTEQDAEVLSLYAAVVGHLCTRQRQSEAQASLEAQLRQAARMEAVGQLAGGVAHDFNNLLTTMSGFSEFLLDGLPDGDPLRADVEQIRAAAARAADLTRQLLAFSRKQMIQPRELDLNEQVRGLEKMLRRLIGEDIELRIALSPAPVWVKADPGQIDQVLMNLLVNAKQAMPTGGRLMLATGEAILDEEYARRHLEVRPGHYVQVSVTDTGVGMDASTLAHIFEPFFTTKGPGEGTGLGLATVYGIVKQNGGHIECHSEPGRGTRFDIYLPHLQPVPDALPTGRAESALTGRETVLLAEDEPAVRALAARILEHHGYTVIEAGNAAEAVRIAEKTHHHIHLLVTDLIMPGMNGRELTRCLQASQPDLQVLYMTGYSDDVLAEHGAEVDGVPVLNKPFTPHDLAELVRRVLDGGHAGQDEAN